MCCCVLLSTRTLTNLFDKPSCYCIMPDRILTSFLAAKNNLKTDKEKTGIYATLWITETHMLTMKELRTQLLTWNRILLFKKLFFFIQVHSAVKGVTKWKTQQEVREKQILSKPPSSDLLANQMRMLAGVLHLNIIS